MGKNYLPSPTFSNSATSHPTMGMIRPRVLTSTPHHGPRHACESLPIKLYVMHLRSHARCTFLVSSEFWRQMYCTIHYSQQSARSSETSATANFSLPKPTSTSSKSLEDSAIFPKKPSSSSSLSTSKNWLGISADLSSRPVFAQLRCPPLSSQRSSI